PVPHDHRGREGGNRALARPARAEATAVKLRAPADPGVNQRDTVGAIGCVPLRRVGPTVPEREPLRAVLTEPGITLRRPFVIRGMVDIPAHGDALARRRAEAMIELVDAGVIVAGEEVALDTMAGRQRGQDT